MYQYLSRRLWLLCACGLLVGCGSDSPTLVPGAGVVNYKGKPIGKINVMLMPRAGSDGMIAEGTTDETGKFTLHTQDGDGVMPGEYTVGFNFVPDVVPEMPGFAGAKKVVSPIPDKYGDAATSGVTTKVESDKSKNNLTFDLK